MLFSLRIINGQEGILVLDTKRLMPVHLGLSWGKCPKIMILISLGSNDDFVSLLEHPALPDLQGYKDLMKSIQDRRIESQKCNIQSKLNKLQEQVLQNFLQVLPEYCSFIRYMSDSASEGQEHIGGEEIPIQTNSYEQLEN